MLPLLETTWQVVKRWLDPRTQMKIEFVDSGERGKARLLEFISPENLPRAYGGTAPDLHLKQDRTGYLQLGRTKHHSLQVDLQPKETLHLDTFVSDVAPLALAVHQTVGENQEDDDGKARRDSIQKIALTGKGAPDVERYQHQFRCPANKSCSFIFRWSNPATNKNLPMVYHYSIDSAQDSDESNTRPAPDSK